jgi:hypothetical protein
MVQLDSVSSSLDDLGAAVQKIREISRRNCRDEFESRFTVEIMAANYERVYYQLTRWIGLECDERPRGRDAISSTQRSLVTPRASDSRGLIAIDFRGGRNKK